MAGSFLLPSPVQQMTINLVASVGNQFFASSCFWRPLASGCITPVSTLPYVSVHKISCLPHARIPLIAQAIIWSSRMSYTTRTLVQSATLRKDFWFFFFFFPSKVTPAGPREKAIGIFGDTIPSITSACNM